jgi:transposase-like protein
MTWNAAVYCTQVDPDTVMVRCAAPWFSPVLWRKRHNAEAEAAFVKIRWPETNCAAVCPKCGGLEAYDCRRPNGAPRFRCRACKGDFSVTSGTLFASHKLPLRAYLAAIALFCNEVKGKSALALSRDLGASYKAAFVLCHKFREAMAEEMKGRMVEGEGKVAGVDGGYFGGYVKPANLRENRVDRRLARNQTGKRKVVIVRERNGASVPAVFRTEAKLSLGLGRATRTEPSSTPTKQPLGTA